MFGLEVQGVAEKLWDFAQHELEDTRLSSRRSPRSAATRRRRSASSSGTRPGEALDHLIETEDEVTEALHAVIPHSGQEARSEALEHLMEHIIMRKQNQIDWLRRARREP